MWIFCDVPLGTVSGVSYMVESWQRELRARGWSTRTFTPSGTRARSSSPSEVTFRTWRHVGYRGDYHARFSTLAQLWRARRDRPDVILVTSPSRVGLLGTALAAVYSIALVMVASTDTTGAAPYYSPARVTLAFGAKPATLALLAGRIRHALLTRSPQPPGQRLAWAARVGAHFGDALQAQATELVTLSRRCVPARRAPHGPTVTSFPVGIDRLPPTPAPPELRWRDGALRVLYVGRYAPEKSLPLLVRALRLAVDDGVDAHLVMVGEGHLREELAALADRLGVADRLTLLGPYERSSLAGIYASADVFAFPSVVETQAFVLNEAAHEGLPLLVSDDEVNQVVCDGRSAVVVAHDPAAYAAALARLQDRQLRERLGAEARRRACGVGEAEQSAKLAAVLTRAVRAHAAERCVDLRPVEQSRERALEQPGQDEQIGGPDQVYRRLPVRRLSLERDGAPDELATPGPRRATGERRDA